MELPPWPLNPATENPSDTRDLPRDPVRDARLRPQMTTLDAPRDLAGTLRHTFVPPARPGRHGMHIPSGNPSVPFRTSAEWHIDRSVDAVRDEFNEMPGMRLTRGQCRRLWSLTVSQCNDILHELIQTEFLVESPSGHVRRKVDGIC